MRLTGRVDFAIRVTLEIAAHEGRTVSLREAAEAQDLPTDYVRALMRDLRRVGIVRSRRGYEGGYTLGPRPDQVSLADILRAIGEPLGGDDGAAGHQYPGVAAPLADVWAELDGLQGRLLESVTLADVLAARATDRGLSRRASALSKPPRVE
ncbi:MAG: Rrf2 family transcriptional regulator [Candidatus Nanopelagicales bacterium]